MDTHQQITKAIYIEAEKIFPKDVVDGSIPDRFYEIVKKFPRKVALKFGKSKYTYDQFNRKTNQIAHLIRDQDQDPGKPIAFLMDNGAESILAIIAILKAGGGYLPLDPSFPTERIEFMVDDAGIKTILTNCEFFEMSQKIAPADTVVINLDQIQSGTNDKNLSLDLSPDGLACLHYTSGSTGKPKGVPQNHRNIMHAAWTTVRTNRFRIEDRIALLYSTGFAASTLPIFGSMLIGACLIPFDFRNNLADLAAWLQEERITIFMGVSTLFRHFAMSVRDDQKFPHLRLITAGGEAVLKSDVELYKKHFSQHSLFRHGIGGTEMQAYRYFYINKDTEILGEIVPVGYPVEDKEVLIVDEDGNLVGYDEIGEIVIRSRYLSPGYWRRPELTREKFKNAPDHPGERLYWTGDLGKVQADGCLYHLGRKDFQVKIRGFRVELGEIESRLMLHPQIREAAVILDEHPGYGERLVTYIVLLDELHSPTSEALRLYLKKDLPDFMLPSAFVHLKAMPLTPTGKVNRLELPKLEEVKNLAQDYVPPQTAGIHCSQQM
jgi:amino acid adenylation domain-containing protein